MAITKIEDVVLAHIVRHHDQVDDGIAEQIIECGFVFAKYTASSEMWGVRKWIWRQKHAADPEIEIEAEISSATASTMGPSPDWRL